MNDLDDYDRGYIHGYDDREEDESLNPGWRWFEFVVGLFMGAVAVRMLF